MVSVITKRKWKIFLQQKRAKIGLFFFVLIFIFSMTAELWSNNKPLFLMRETEVIVNHKFTGETKKKIFFPDLLNYNPEDLGILDSFIVNYKEIIKSDIERKKETIVFFPLNKWDAEEQTEDVLVSPSKEHFFGTDNLGRDIFARLLYGIRISISFSLILWIFSYLVGVIIGAIQGYFFGVFDFIVERIKEYTSIIPMLSVIILVTAITKDQSFWMILFLVLIFGWMGMASQIRASVLSLRKSEFCNAALALGSTNSRVLIKHILPNSLTAVITLSPFAIEGGISLLTALDYLGFGLPPPTPSIGELMAQGKDNIQNAPWLLIFPILTILLLLISISLIGQALRDAFDPKVSS